MPTISAQQQRIPLTEDGKFISREWLKLLNLDAGASAAAIAALQTSLDAANATVAALQALIADQAAAIAALTADVAELESAEQSDEVSASLHSEAKMRHIARAAVRDLEPPNSANTILMARMFNRR